MGAEDRRGHLTSLGAPGGVLAAGGTPQPQLPSRTQGEGSLQGPSATARAAPQVLITKGSVWPPVIGLGFSFFFFFLLLYFFFCL